MKNSLILFTFLCLANAAYSECKGGQHDSLWKLLKSKESRNQYNHLKSKKDSSVYMGPQKGLKEADKIKNLPGQPQHVKFSQYSGYVTVDPKAGRALFYYFAEAENPKDKPLVLWLNGGPGCSSIGNGAMTELGPFRVKRNGKTLWHNKYAWNKVANVLFLESPAGVGFSYSNRSSDYVTGDTQTAADSYTFLVNWLERFPEYKTRDFFLTGESYAGHYIPQLAELILNKNKNTTHTVIRLKGMAIGNAFMDDTDFYTGLFNYRWTHPLISDQTYSGIVKNCKFSPGTTNYTRLCVDYANTADTELGNINQYDIYAPLCLNRSSATTPSVGMSGFDPCSENYVHTYLNTNEVQKALHADVGGITKPWEFCSDSLGRNWTDSPVTILPVLKKIMQSGIRVSIYSGDTDAVVPVTTTKYSLPKLGAQVKISWYPWYYRGEVGGYAVGYSKNLTFATVRGSGHMIPSYKPGQALTLFTSFLQGKSPPQGNKRSRN